MHAALFGEINYHAAYDPQRSLRTQRWKYIRRFGARRKPVLCNIDDSPSKDVWLEHDWADHELPGEALYDLIFDPNEVHNLADDERFGIILADLSECLDEWMQSTDDPLFAGPNSGPVRRACERCGQRFSNGTSEGRWKTRSPTMTDSPQFQRQTIYTGPPGERTLCVVGDLTGNEVPDIVVASRGPQPELFWLRREDDGTWAHHIIDTDIKLAAGGYLADINSNGRQDFVAGTPANDDRVFWWANPDDPTKRWQRTEIFQMPGTMSHDQFVADVDGDGRMEVYFWNQQGHMLFYAPVPDDPYQSPWPQVYVVISDLREEGLAAADVDGDGRLELIAGQSWYRAPDQPGGVWRRYPFVDDYLSPRVAAADFAGDGQIEIVVAEGDATIYGPPRGRSKFGRVARCRPGKNVEALWQVEVLHDHLLDPHSLFVADFTGNGLSDLFVGELGNPKGDDDHPPAQRIFFNCDGDLVEHVIETGLGTHESKAIQIDGKTGIVGKPFRIVREGIPRTPDIDSIHLWLPKDL